MNLYKQLNLPIHVIHYIESSITVLLTPIFAKSESELCSSKDIYFYAENLQSHVSLPVHILH